MKDDHELQKENPELYRIARGGGTEAPFTSNLLHVDDDGIFHCAVCNAPLFSTDTKFDSGTGWPSFTKPITKDAVTYIDDESHGMRRIEVRCKNCNAHLGHVFTDGPLREDGKGHENRYCINGTCLDLQNT